MPSTLPEGDPVPYDGALPASALGGLGGRPFGFYVHVPFCVTRCGYCDFNTYTATELRGVSQASYADTEIAEVRLARRVLGDADLPVETVFVGGGTPTLLPAADLGRVLEAIGKEFGLAPGAEVTTESNPETVDPGYLGRLREAGFTRVSFGMQSAREHVLAVLDRTHTPGRPQQCVGWARELFQEAAPFATGGAYVNFMPADEADRVATVYGGNYRRLLEVKRRWDPQNRFRTNQNIRPTG